jgi:glycosyltransferase involved in cell wall biosynthesis
VKRSPRSAESPVGGPSWRIGFDGSVLAQRFWTGVEKSFVTTLAAVRRLAPDYELVVLAPRPPSAPLPAGVRFERVPGPRLGWRLRALPGWMRRLGLRVWHAPVTALPVRSPCPRIATVHELPWCEPGVVRDNGSGWRQRARLWWTARTAEWVVVPSEHTKQRLLQCHPRLADRVRVVPHGIEAARFAMAPADVVATCARIGVQRDGYFLVLGQLRQRKNLAFLLHAYQRACELHADLPPLHRVGPPGRFVPEELLPA